MLAWIFLWLAFLVSQQQKSNYGHCTWGYGGWFVAQVRSIGDCKALVCQRVLSFRLAFLVSQQQKSNYGHCIWGYGGWFMAQVGLHG